MRSASSGAWNTMHRKEGATAHAGDVESADEEGRLFTNQVMIEAKWYKKEDSLLFEVLVCKKQQVLGWWAKCEKEATDVLKTPMLVVKFNQRVPFIAIPNYFYSEVYKKFGNPKAKSSLIIQLDFDDTIYKHVVIMRFDEFLAWCKPSFFTKKK